MTSTVKYNARKAKSEGWLLSERDDGLYEIQRYDDDPKETFPLTADGDDLALAYVKARADAGSPMHAKAFALHGTKWSVKS